MDPSHWVSNAWRQRDAANEWLLCSSSTHHVQAHDVLPHCDRRAATPCATMQGRVATTWMAHYHPWAHCHRTHP